MTKYDENNVFLKIIEENNADNFIYSDSEAIVIRDKYPMCETHLLYIPRKKIANFREMKDLDIEEQVKIYKSFSNFLKFLEQKGITAYNVTANVERNQVIYHMHIHITSDQKLENKK